MSLSKFVSWVLLGFTLSIIGVVGIQWLDSCAAGRTAEAWAKGAFLFSFMVLAVVAALAVSGNVEITLRNDYGDLFGDEDDDDPDDPPVNPYRSQRGATRPLAGHGHDDIKPA